MARSARWRPRRTTRCWCWWSRRSAGRPWLGSGLGAVVGAQVAYAGNRRWTFAHRGRIAASWPRFQATALLGALARHGASSPPACGSELHYLLAQVVATAAGLLLTFAVNRRWTFG